MKHLERFLMIAMIATLVWCGIVLFKNRNQDGMACGCGHDEVSEVEALQDVGEFETNAAKQKIIKVWFNGAAPNGWSEERFQAAVMRGFEPLEQVTNCDFVQTTQKSGSYIEVYVVSDEWQWKKFPKLKPDNVVYLAVTIGKGIYATVRARWYNDEVVSGCFIHEFGHRLGVQHSTDPTSIMNPNLTTYKMNANDIKKFQQRLGKKPLSFTFHRPLAIAC